MPLVDCYGLFEATTGADVEDNEAFGFPVTFEQHGATRRGHYELDDLRHRIVADDPHEGDPAPATGTLVTRALTGAAGATYTAVTVPGTFARWAPEPENLAELANEKLLIEDYKHL